MGYWTDYKAKRDCWVKIGSENHVYVNSDGYVEFSRRRDVYGRCYDVYPYRKYYKHMEDGSMKFQYASAAYLKYDYFRKLYNMGLIEFCGFSV